MNARRPPKFSALLLKPSLDDAYLRVDRAQHHMVDLEHRLRRFSKRTNLVLSPTVPPICSILIGETIYNQRAALDYLIYELAILDSGRIQDGTQFPIESWPEDKSGQDKLTQRWSPNNEHGLLRGLSGKHKAMIREFQPFAGCQWTSDLQKFSNPDKHRRLIGMNWQARLRHRDFDSQAKPPRPKPAVKVYGTFTNQILFDDRSPVIKTLETFDREITAVLDQFHPDFL